MDLSFSVKGWQAWPTPTGNADSPDVSSIPPLLRRRLNPLGRVAVSVMLPLFEQYGAMPIVFCSRHGDVAKTLGMLETLAQGEPLSPTAFSLSVHNALAGLFSIHRKSEQPITAIAAGAEELVPVLLECLGQLQNQAEHVLCVFCDEPLPEFYASDLPPGQRFAAAFVISRGEQFRLLATPPEAEDVESNTPEQPQALQFADFLAGAEAQYSLREWCIQRQ